MEDISLLLCELADKGVRIWTDGGHLRFHPKSLLSRIELEALRAKKGEIIALLAGTSAPDAHTPLSSRSRGERIPLTFQQQWLWMLRAKTHWHFPMGFALRIRSPLDLTSLRLSLRALLARHESLRTKIALLDGVPHQVIVDLGAARELDVVQLADNGSDDADSVTRQTVQSIDARHIDPETDPVFTATLITRRADDYVLSIALDHLVADGFSVAIFLRDLWLEYMGCATARAVQPSSGIDGAIQYADYAVWQHKTARSWDERHGRYWQIRLEGAERVRPPREVTGADISPGSSVSLPIQFGMTLTNRLRAEAPRLGATTPLAILAMYALLLSRWSGQNDFVLPFNSVGRHVPELDDTIGYFAHVLHLRIQLQESDTLRDLLQRVVGEFYAASEHQDFARIVATRPEFIEGTWFQFDPAFPIGDPNVRTPETDWLDANLKLEPFPFSRVVPEMKSEIDVVLYLSESPLGISGTFSYRTDLFTAQTVERFVSGLPQLVVRLLDEPEASIASVPF